MEWFSEAGRLVSFDPKAELVNAAKGKKERDFYQETQTIRKIK